MPPKLVLQGRFLLDKHYVLVLVFDQAKDPHLNITQQKNLKLQLQSSCIPENHRRKDSTQVTEKQEKTAYLFHTCPLQHTPRHHYGNQTDVFCEISFSQSVETKCIHMSFRTRTHGHQIKREVPLSLDCLPLDRTLVLEEKVEPFFLLKCDTMEI